ncbi:MAG: hypothetical protein Q9160_005161 [Pyrenula sp. 1 TL-2023]
MMANPWPRSAQLSGTKAQAPIPTTPSFPRTGLPFRNVRATVTGSTFQAALAWTSRARRFLCPSTLKTKNQHDLKSLAGPEEPSNFNPTKKKSGKMVSSYSTLATILAAFSFTANGHMIIKTPVPYSQDSLNNSPLDASGSDYPCKLRADTYKVTKENMMKIGEKQTLSFTGSAVHGGGSCQISLTSDREPTKNSKFQVIHSIEGGCPASAAGNLDSDPNGSGASTFDFQIPDSIKPGQYTLAWTWFNKIGNREMYMNCAPATITGGGSKRDMMRAPISAKRDANLPDMFIANLASINSCKTADSKDLKFPDPGQSVQNVTPDGQLAPPTGCSGGSSSGSGSGDSGAGAGSGSGSGSGAGAGAGAGAGEGSGSGSGSNSATTPSSSAPGVFASGAASPSSAAPSNPTATAVSGGSGSAGSSGAAPSSGTAPSSPSTSGTSTGSTGGANSGPCTQEGAFACSADGSSFQRCASGAWSAAIPMAGGTKCTPGTSENLQMKAIAARRSVRPSRD